YLTALSSVTRSGAHCLSVSATHRSHLPRTVHPHTDVPACAFTCGTAPLGTVPKNDSSVANHGVVCARAYGSLPSRVYCITYSRLPRTETPTQVATTRVYSNLRSLQSYLRPPIFRY